MHRKASLPVGSQDQTELTASQRQERLLSVGAEGVTAAAECQQYAQDRYCRRIKTLLTLAPVSIFTLSIFVLSYALVPPFQAFGKARYRVRTNIEEFITAEHTDQSSPDLQKIVADVASALEDANVTHWLKPGLGLFPCSKRGYMIKDCRGRLNPWQDGVDFGVFHEDAMQILLTQAKLQETGIVAVESYFGLRLFPLSGQYDDRYDFRTPFVDLVYFRVQGDNIVNSCCDCGPVTVGPCTKKTCACLGCAFALEEIFPLTTVRIESVRRQISAPRNTSALLLPAALPVVHPAVFAGVDS